MKPRPLERKVIGVFGSTGQGKTQAAKAILRSLRVTQRGPLRILALDPMEQLQGGDDYEADVQYVAYSRAELLAYLQGIRSDESFSVSYVPPVGADEAAELNFLAGVAWALGNVWLYVDEAHASCNHRAFDGGDIPLMAACVKRGRHRRINLLIGAQRPVDVATLVRAETLAGETYYFRLVRHDDLRDIASERGPEFSRAVQGLPRLTCICATADGAHYVSIRFDSCGVPCMLRANGPAVPSRRTA
jgi:hypothetical protein